MKLILLTLLTAVFAMTAVAADIGSGDDLIAAMHKKYDGKWYKTLTFVQKTTNYKADGTSEASTWYEALDAPGRLRIDFTPLDKHDGIIFADGKIYTFRDGKTPGGRPYVHPLLVLGFDVYMQPVETTISQIKGLGIDTAIVHQEDWQGKPVYVVGAAKGDMSKPQFWVDKKSMLFVRLIQFGGRDKKSVLETQFNNYVKARGGWVAAEVKFTIDGKPQTTEAYSEIRTGMKLDPTLWDPEKWTMVDRSYYKKKK